MKYTISILLFLAFSCLLAGIRFILHNEDLYEIKAGFALLTSAVFLSGAFIVDAIDLLRGSLDK